MNLHSKVVYTFNKLYGNFLRDIKGVNDDVKRRVKANYKVIVKSSPDHITFFWGGFSKHAQNIDPSNIELLEVGVFKDIPLGDILSSVGESDVVMVWNYVYMLCALSMIYNEPSSVEADVEDVINIDDEPSCEPEPTDEEDVNASVFDRIVKVFGATLRGDDVTNDLSEFDDDNIRSVLSKLVRVDRNDDAAPPLVDGPDAPMDDIMNMFSSLENSKICNLAKEISKEIDVSNLKIDSPQDVMKLMDFSNGNNMLGNIIGKVSSKIQEKMSNGEIKHEDLLGEAMNMMGMMQKTGAGGGLFNNPMMAELMKGMKKGKAVPRADVLKKESTKEKLRRRLEERQQQKK